MDFLLYFNLFDYLISLFVITFTVLGIVKGFYQEFISIGIWRSAENYKGNMIWITITFIIIAYRCYSLRLMFFI